MRWMRKLLAEIHWKWLMMPSLFSRALTKYWSTGAGFGKPVMPSKLMCLDASSRHIASKDAPRRPAFLSVSANALWPASLWSQSALCSTIGCSTRSRTMIGIASAVVFSTLSSLSLGCSACSSAFSASAGASSASASGASSAVGSVSSSGTLAVNLSTTSASALLNAAPSSGVSSSLVEFIVESPLVG